MRYIDGDLVASIMDAFRKHVSVDQISERTGIDPADIRQLVGEPVVVPAAADQDFDLFEGAERLNGVL